MCVGGGACEREELRRKVGGKAAAASSSSSTKNEPLSEEQIPESLFFAHQVTTNACAVSNTGSSFKMNISVYHVLFCSIFNPN